jgi:hypothetical protein
MLRPQKITRETLPSDLTRNWIGANGAARVEFLPSGDSNAQQNKRHKRQQYISQAMQRDPQQDRDRDQGQLSGLEEGPNNHNHAFVEFLAPPRGG